jgi:hypothetical protein
MTPIRLTISNFCIDGGCDDSQPVWDADYLRAYLEAGGQNVIYVGERGSGDACGISSTRRFQHMLQNEMELVETIAIPSWWLNEVVE